MVHNWVDPVCEHLCEDLVVCLGERDRSEILHRNVVALAEDEHCTLPLNYSPTSRSNVSKVPI